MPAGRVGPEKEIQTGKGLVDIDMTAPILIFGGTGGIGSALARRLTAAGRPLHLVARDQGKLDALGGELGARTSTCDVTDPDAIAETVATAAGEEGLAGMAFCVGSIVIKPLKSLTPDDLEAAWRLNTVGAAMAAQASAKPLAQAEGAMLFFSTIAVQQGYPSHAVIAAAKGGIEGLTRSLAAELAPKVRVNALAPTLTRTPLAEPLTRNEKMAESLAESHPMGRLGEPDDVAALGAHLLAPESAYITGQVIPVDGGRSSLRSR
jgi:NAD(P)-dependent dehydrogenase (short-subunit alcohol dehydrogenase family)